jgi:hypothetical protein
MMAYATLYQQTALICNDQYYDGCFFPPAADPARPSAYAMLWTRDFEYTLEFLYVDFFDQKSREAALNQTLYIMEHQAMVNCGNACTSDQPMFQAKLIANLANFTRNSTLFCSNYEKLWAGLVSRFY